MTAAQCFALFLNGYTCEEIARDTPGWGGYAHGVVLRARIENNWDEQKREHSEQLMKATRERVERSTLEGIKFAADGMAVFHKIAGERFRNFIKSGNPEDLGEFQGMPFRMYKDLVELMRIFSGNDTKKTDIKISGSVTTEQINVIDGDVVEKPMTQESAADILARLVSGNGEDK